MKKTIIILLCAFVVVGTTLSIVFYNYGQNSTNPEMEKKNKKIGELANQLDRIGILYSSTAFTKDSLSNINKLLSKYRALTDAMSYRDSIRNPLSFRKGDIVRLKRDSSYVLVDDIIVGGGQFEFYIKYIVEHRDGKSETVSPEKIFQ